MAGNSARIYAEGKMVLCGDAFSIAPAGRACGAYAWEARYTSVREAEGRVWSGD